MRGDLSFRSHRGDDVSHLSELTVGGVLSAHLGGGSHRDSFAASDVSARSMSVWSNTTLGDVVTLQNVELQDLMFARLGSGDDVVMWETDRGLNGRGEIRTGRGDDEVTIGLTGIRNSRVLLGSDDDKLNLTDDVIDVELNLLDGGAGIDTLVGPSPSASVAGSIIRRFEQ